MSDLVDRISPVEPADVAKGLALGATGYMSKPARPQALIQAIRNVLGIEHIA